MTLSLEPLGLGPREDRVYLRLVDLGSADAGSIARDLGLTPDEVRDSLRVLTERGLTHQDGLRSQRYRALSPQLALPELIRRRRADLVRLQTEADQLAQDVGSALTGGGAAVVPLVGAAAVHDMCARIQRGAEREVLMVDAPPYFDCGVQPNPSEFAALASGVSYRVVYHSEAVVAEVEREAMRGYIAAGEDARVNAQAWPKMLVVDGSIAVIPESSTHPDPERRLLITSSSIVDLLVLQFESLWERSTPVEAAGRLEPQPDADHISERDRELLMLMAGGLKDRAIARSLGVTERTVSRRIQELMRRLDADTRFRAGIRAVQEGWIAS
ncbi:helix-turn-helix transcriptional regulator [Knoellia subterranea]|nr:helix-turn-helix domain-containing protein [Knoellia subterranea]